LEKFTSVIQMVSTSFAWEKCNQATEEWEHFILQKYCELMQIMSHVALKRLPKFDHGLFESQTILLSAFQRGWERYEEFNERTYYANAWIVFLKHVLLKPMNPNELPEMFIVDIFNFFRINYPNFFRTLHSTVFGDAHYPTFLVKPERWDGLRVI